MSAMDRKEIEALLVFLANDTLEGEERAEVEAAVAADPVLQSDLEALKRIRTEMQAEEFGRSPGEFGLARLMRDIDREKAAPVQQQQAQVVRPRVWQAVAAAAVALMVAQGLFVWNRGTGDDGFAVQPAGASDDTITVAFKDGVSLTDVQALLTGLGAVIVDGPSALGLYTVRPLNADEFDAVLAGLEGNGALVDSAQSNREE